MRQALYASPPRRSTGGGGFGIAGDGVCGLRLDADGDIEWIARESGTERIHRTEPESSAWRRFAVGVLRLLPIDEQL
jgi:hypothetical protein